MGGEDSGSPCLSRLTAELMGSVSHEGLHDERR